MESALAIRPDMTARQVAVHGVTIAAKRDAGTGGLVMLALRGAETFGPEWVDGHG